MKIFKIKNKKNLFLIAFYQTALAAYLVGVSAVNAGCNQLGGLLKTQLTDTSDPETNESLGLTSDDDGEGASLTQAPSNAPYGLKVNPVASSKETAVYGIFDIPQ